AEPLWELRALIDDEHERTCDDEHAGGAQKPRLSTRVKAGGGHEEDEERGAQAERDTGVRQRAACDLERRRRWRGLGDLRDRRDWTVPDDEHEVSLGGVTVDRARRRPCDDVAAVTDRPHGDPQSIHIA